MKRIFNIIIAALLCTAVIGSTAYAVSRIGSSGQEVTNIQTRLKQWGYYTGSVDGVYGQKTADAVKSFQRSNGLTADGIAGAATLEKIGLPTGGSSSGGSSQGSSSRDVQLLAQAINGEARGESYTGQVAVGAVILNRVRHSSFPNTIAGVIYQPGAFTAVSDGQINLTPQTSCYNAARDALNGWDPTGGCLNYYNPKATGDRWIRTRTVKTVIGNHSFAV
ncbi:MAG: spore cortex-lytic enzyme [Clostridia bacterium]|nr:spore cortex-lytic enzyme [Clostridia bacterium]